MTNKEEELKARIKELALKLAKALSLIKVFDKLANEKELSASEKFMLRNHYIKMEK